MIEDRLAIYGPSICFCGNHKESVFFGRYQLTCRNHPGHPLYTEKEPTILENRNESVSAPARQPSC